MNNDSLKWLGITHLGWLVLNVIFGFTSASLAGDLYYLNAYLWPISVSAWLFIFAAYFFNSGDWRLTESRSVALGWVFVVLGVFAFYLQFSHMYTRSYALKSTVVEVTWDQSAYTPGFDPRFNPYPVAKALLPNVQGDTQGSTLLEENITFISDPVNGNRWTGIADANTWATTTKGIVVVPENGESYTCKIFMDSVTHGTWWSSITNRVRQYDFTYYVDTDDIYGDCVNGEARIVVPLQKTRGLNLVRYPAGIAVFDKNGAISLYVSGNIPADIYGPVYPISLAAAQRASLTTGHGFWSWVFSEYGYDPSSDAESPNAGNESEFTLLTASDLFSELVYVTPLTPKGTSQSIIGESVIVADTFTAGQYNQLVFVRYNLAKAGIKDIGTNFKVDHREIDWASGHKVMEIIPGPGDSYVGYIGQGTVVKYQFTYTNGIYTYVEYGTPSSLPVTVPSVPSATSSDVCTDLWVQLSEAGNRRDLSQVLYVTSQLVASGCQ